MEMEGFALVEVQGPLFGTGANDAICDDILLRGHDYNEASDHEHRTIHTRMLLDEYTYFIFCCLASRANILGFELILMPGAIMRGELRPCSFV